MKYLKPVAWILLLAGCLASCMEKNGGIDETRVKILASFEDGQTTPFTMSAPGAVVEETHFATHGKKALKFSTGYATWNDADQHWHDYDFLLIDAYLDGDDALDFDVTIFDSETDNYWTRVNYPTVVIPGKNTLKIPLDIAVGEKSRPGRPLKKDAVTRILFSISNNESTNRRFVYVDNIRLEKEAPDKTWFYSLKAFSFGNPRLSLMGGFTRVTADCMYSSEKGYGWQDAQLSYPLDPFQPDILYRSTTHVRSGDFIMDLPNGKYHVFMNIDAPNGFWGETSVYRNRRVSANGKEVVNDTMDRQMALDRFFRYAATEDLYDEDVFDKYVTPHYTEKEFEVEVTDGQLTLSFQTESTPVRMRGDNNAIALSALIVYPAQKQKEGKKFLANLVERRREDFNNTFRKTLHIDNNPEPEMSPTQKKQRYVIFNRSMEEDIYPNSKPATDELTELVSAAGAAGTMEPMTFAIRSYKDFGDVRVTAGDFKTEDGRRIPSGAIQVGYVSNRLTRLEMGGSRYTVAPRYLMNDNRVSLPAKTTRWFWAIIDVPVNVGKGLYKGEFSLDFGNGEKGTLAASFEVVYDKPLPKMDIPVGPWGIEIRTPWFQQEMADLTRKTDRASLDLMRKTGFTTFTTGLRLRPEGKGKDLILHFDVADSLMNLAKIYGMTAFVNYGAFISGMNVYGYPNPTDPQSFGFDNEEAMWKHVISLIDKHAQEKHWLPVFISTSDEPHVLADQQKCAALNTIFKKYNTPRVRFAGITSITETHKGDFTQEFCESMDIANLNLHDRWAIDLLHKAGTDWAFYNGGNRWTFGPYMYMLAQRYNMLFRVSWHWNCNSGDPYYALDGREDDYCWANMTPDGALITSISFERLRRGIVDYRYLLALKELIAEKPDHPLAVEAKTLLDEILALKPGADRGMSETETKKMFQRAQAYRDKAIAILRNDTGSNQRGQGYMDMMTKKTKVFNYIDQLYKSEKRVILSGQTTCHNQARSLEAQYRFIDELAHMTGKYPGMLAVDYGYSPVSNRLAEVNDYIIDYWNRGGLVSVGFHPGNPATDGSAWDTDFDGFREMATEGTPLNIKWTTEVLDKIADALAMLRDNGVVVLWRPFHEMNGDWFWWCPHNAKTGEWRPNADFKGIWVQMYKYFTETRQLDNLLWVYSPNVSYGGEGTIKTDYYYPGDEYVDIVALDWYTNTVDNLNSDESYDRLVALGKPFGVSEFGPEKQCRDGSFDNLLIVKALTEGPWRSAFFIYWDSWTSRTDGYCHVAIMDNKNADALMSHQKVINRDKVSWMP